ncbi:hypothetical protein GPECTOR_1g379 [Gonium pectorale]|uniref:Importin N-terminal domain-containing protein n=1 Tax=Gonium pectorale TaxID=33097 RepID=A0A150H312_GONPE|nr:hypothetical protein GPECTOR_1g379 [Gonium pectorale]|eukprot:KXZ56425.1 hypothetical protein GPECTOR_1g379 [Gonium pectorale]
MGADVLAERAKIAAGTLQRWAEVPPAEWQTALQHLAMLLSTGSHQPAEAARAAGAVTSLAALLQLPPSQLPHETARRVAWALELLVNGSPDAAREVSVTATPAIASRLAAALTAAGAAGAGRVDAGVEPSRDEELLLADQLTAVLGSTAAWGPEHQGTLLAQGAAAPVLQLLLATVDAACSPQAAPEELRGSQTESMAIEPQQQQQTPQQAAESPATRCCATALWALGMLVRGRGEEALQLTLQPALLTGLRRMLLQPSTSPSLLREAAWLLAFISAAGGPDAAAALVEGGGLLPGLLLSTMRYAQRAAAFSSDDPAASEAAQPLHQALLPLLAALANLAAEPRQTPLVLAELQAARPLPATPPAASGGSAGPPPAAAGHDVVSASGMQAVVACLGGRVGHRGVVRGAAALAAALAWGACRSGSVTLDAVRSALGDAGVVGALVEVLRSAALDIRKEAAAALTSLCQGAAAAEGGGVPGSGGAAVAGPDTLDMLRSLGIHKGRDEHGVLAAFLGLLRSPDADAVHAGLRFVTLVLGGLKRGPQLVESLDGIDALEAVQYGTSGCRVPELQAWAEELVDLHYGEEYGEGDDEDGDEIEGM